MTTPDLIASIEARIQQAKAERDRLEAARAVLTGKRLRGRPRQSVSKIVEPEFGIRVGPPRLRIPMPELDAALRSRVTR